MKKTERTLEEVLTESSKLHKECMNRIILENSMSEQTMEAILTPAQKLELEEKYEYTKALITILKTTKNEQEIIQKAQEAYRNLQE